MPRVGGARTAEALVAVAVAVATIACVDTAEVAVAGTGRCVHGHSPVWDAALQRLHWVEMSGFSSGLNLLQGFDGRMEAKLLREKLLIRGRVSLLGACAAYHRGCAPRKHQIQ